MKTQQPTEHAQAGAPGPEATIEAKLAWIESTQAALDERGVAVLEEVFATIWRTHAENVRRRILKWGVTPAEAKELTQDVFLALLLHVTHRGGWPGVRTNLRTIVRGKLLHYVRAHRSEPESVCMPSSGSALPESEVDIDRAVDYRALARMLLPELREAQRAVVQLCILDDRTDLEAAAALRIPEGTVKSLLRAAKRTLRELARSKLPPSQQNAA